MMVIVKVVSSGVVWGGVVCVVGRNGRQNYYHNITISIPRYVLITISSSPSPLQSVYPVVVAYDGVLIFIRVCNFCSRFMLDGIELVGVSISRRV